MEPFKHFAANYAQARANFQEAARQAKLGVTGHTIPGVLGAQGEALSMDTCLFGNPGADKLLIVTSGIHGVEGFCGSGCQSALLSDTGLLERAAQGETSILFVHAVNPFGFSHLRRVNEDNVDLNRNFVSFGEPQQANPVYAELEPLLLPDSWPPSGEVLSRLDAWLAANGVDNYGQAVFQGQYDSPGGMFFGGNKPTWSNSTIRHVVRSAGQAAKQIGWIDLHTGLGPRGHCEKVFMGGPGELDRARAWWGSDVIATNRDDSVMYEINGPMVSILAEECPGAEPTTIALEFGTVTFLKMIDGLRADHFFWRSGDAADPGMKLRASHELKACFYVDAPDWQGMVYGQARTAVLQALCGLA
ncbi:MAG: M14 family metallopeptidase [Pseudomonadota bacterium]